MIKNCKQCLAKFEIIQEDLNFYDKISPVFNWKKYKIPMPTLCPDCRFKRRASWRNERNLYKRRCNATEKNIISIYSSDKLYKVYSQDEWWSDKWSWLDYWACFDFNKSFFEQFKKLMYKVPRLSLLSKNSENSEYINHWSNNKDCYLSTIVFNSENILHSRKIFSSNIVLDSSYIFWKWEMLYECFWWENLYNCKYCNLCLDSSNLLFCYDCKWCTDCFMSYNLRNKKYCFNNEQLSENEYKEKIKNINTWDFSQIQNLLKDFQQAKLKAIHKNLNNEHCENSKWDFLLHCKNVNDCYLAAWWENCKYCIEFDYSASHNWSRNCMDAYWFWDSELLYEIQAQANWYNNQFCNFSYDIIECMYADNCHNSKYLFGCIWLKNNSYCILNKQYTKQEYEILVPKIIEHMKKTHLTSSGLSYGQEWWEFFPIELSPFAYNETVAQEYFPLKKEEILKKDWKWKDEDTSLPKVAKIINANKLPDNIKDIPDDILAWAIQCENTQKPFKIIPQELKFYRENNIPIPHLHPDERHKERMKLRNPRKLYDRKCNKCEKHIQTTYSPDRLEIVYCEECYLQTVY